MKQINWVLMVIALVVHAGTLRGDNMWGLIAAYWLVLCIKYMLEGSDGKMNGTE